MLFCCRSYLFIGVAGYHLVDCIDICVDIFVSLFCVCVFLSGLGYFMEQMKALETRGKARAAKETAKRTTQTSGSGSSSQGQGVGGKKTSGSDEDSSEPKQVRTLS